MDKTPYQMPPLVERKYDTELELSFFSQMALEVLPVDKDREAWISFICRHPYALSHFLTLSFLRAYHNDESKRALRHMMRCVGRELFGKRGMKKKVGLTGFVIAEPHEISYDKEGSLHFHLLIGASEGALDSDELAAALLRALSKPRDRFGRQMCVPEITDMKDIDNLKGAARYVTKNFSKKDWAKGEGIYFITPEGLDGDATAERQLGLRWS